ncbi:MAG: molecular chaperone HtpG [Candidatus Kapaibacteriales bacterium]
MEAKKFEFKAEMKQLLDILVHSLYTNKDVFIRELVSNSSDALNKIRFKKLTDSNIRDIDSELRIDITTDKENGTFTISDSGIGMDESDLQNALGTIASSGTSKFIEGLKESGGKIDGQSMIGKFGVGFYSVFMATDEVTIDTLKADKDSKALKWISNGEEGYTISEGSREERGTTITFKVKDDAKDYLEDWKLKSVIEKYSAFIDYPIYVNGERGNTQKAIWHKSKDDVSQDELNEFYKFISNDYKDPLTDIWLNIEGTVNFKSILFLPSNAPINPFSRDFETVLHLYTSNVFISSDTDELLPEYLKFVKGVVDTDDLPLNVSREVTQNSPVVSKIRDILTSRVLKRLEEMAKDEPDNFEIFFKEFGSIFKTGVNSEFKHKDTILELLRFNTLKEGDKLVSLSGYVDSMKDGQKEIYYLLANSYQAGVQHPHSEAFKKKGYDVLILSDPIDPFVVPGLMKYKDFDIKSIEDAELPDTNDESKEDDTDKAPDTVIEIFKEILGERVEDVVTSSKLVDSPVSLKGSSGMDSHTERMMKMMDKNFKSPKKTLEVNTSHQLIKNIHKQYITGEDKAKITQTVNHLLDSALLTEGYLENPYEYVKKVYDVLTETTN